jgi:hypothetical protein
MLIYLELNQLWQIKLNDSWFVIKKALNSYFRIQGFTQMWDRAESNRRHTDFQSVALPTELQSLIEEAKDKGFSNLTQSKYF